MCGTQAVPCPSPWLKPSTQQEKITALPSRGFCSSSKKDDTLCRFLFFLFFFFFARCIVKYNGISSWMEVRNAALVPDSSARWLSSRFEEQQRPAFLCVYDNGACLHRHALQALGHNKSPTDSLFSDYSHKVSEQAFLWTRPHPGLSSMTTVYVSGWNVSAPGENR